MLLEVIRDASSANGLSCQHLNFIQLTGPLPHLVSMLRALSAGTNVGVKSATDVMSYLDRSLCTSALLISWKCSNSFFLSSSWAVANTVPTSSSGRRLSVKLRPRTRSSCSERSQSRPLSRLLQWTQDRQDTIFSPVHTVSIFILFLTFSLYFLKYLDLKKNCIISVPVKAGMGNLFQRADVAAGFLFQTSSSSTPDSAHLIKPSDWSISSVWIGWNKKLLFFFTFLLFYSVLSLGISAYWWPNFNNFAYFSS